MRLERARRIVDFVVSEAAAPVSVFVADTHGELVAAATMDGAAPDTRLNAQRKAYTAARSDARTTRELAEKVRDDAVETRELRSLLHVLPRRRRGLRGSGARRSRRCQRPARRGRRAARPGGYRTIRGSVNTSVSSRLRVENSDTTAPSAPGLEPVQRVGRDRPLLTRSQDDLVLALDLQPHEAQAAAERLLFARIGSDRRVAVLRAQTGAGRARAPSRRRARCSRRPRSAARSPRGGRARSRPPRSTHARRR